MSSVGAGEEVVPASEYRALQSQVRELQRLLGKKTLDSEILREAWDLAQSGRIGPRHSHGDMVGLIGHSGWCVIEVLLVRDNRIE
jgi:hypothetical protein